MTGNSWKRLCMAGNGWTWLKMAVYCCKLLGLLEFANMAVNNCIWLVLAVNEYQKKYVNGCK